MRSTPGHKASRWRERSRAVDGPELQPAGPGGRGDTAPYAVEREIDDIAALIQQAGGSASVFGHSSGATLALKAAASGLPITHLVLYEPPFNTDDNYPALPAGFAGNSPSWCPRAAAVTPSSCTRHRRSASPRR